MSKFSFIKGFGFVIKIKRVILHILPFVVTITISLLASFLWWRWPFSPFSLIIYVFKHLTLPGQGKKNVFCKVFACAYVCIHIPACVREWVRELALEENPLWHGFIISWFETLINSLMSLLSKLSHSLLFQNAPTHSWDFVLLILWFQKGILIKILSDEEFQNVEQSDFLLHWILEVKGPSVKSQSIGFCWTWIWISLAGGTHAC